ncbi:MAG TPA: Rid family detoxifying hydrolase [Gemmatimonadales bacterium]|jgi:reactive intermediate/imine deaminase
MRAVPWLLVLFVPATAFAQERQAIRPPGSITGLPFTPAIKVGTTIYAAGQVGIPPGGRELVAGGITEQTRQALENLDRVFQAAGTRLANSVKCTVFLADIADFQAMNTVYATFFPNDPPARSTVAVSGLAFGAKVEIECIAVMAT